MPTRKQPHSKYNWKKLERPKIHLMCVQMPVKSLRRFRKPEAHADVEKNDCQRKRHIEGLTHDAKHYTPCFDNEEGEQDNEDQERESLKRETA